MKEKEIVIGLDIGTTKIVVIIAKRNKNKDIEIIGMGLSKSKGIHKGVVNNINKTIDSITEAIRDAEERSGLNINEVIVGIAGQHIRSLEHSNYIIRENFEEVIDQEDIQRLISQVYKFVILPGEKIIDVLPKEYKVDNQSEIIEPLGMYGSRLEANFHVVLGQISSIRNIERCIQKSGLSLSSIILESLASAEAILSNEEKEIGVAIIDIGGGTTDIAIFKNGIIRHTSVIPFGGKIITEDLKDACSIIERQAELLKIKFGSACPEKNKDTEIVYIPGLKGKTPKEISLKYISQIINIRIKEIIKKVYVEILNYGHEDKKKRLIGGLVLTGGGSKLKHLKEITENITGIDTRIGYIKSNILKNKYQNLNSPEYTTSIGLIIKGFEKLKKSNKKNINNFKNSLFLSEEKIKEIKKNFKKKTLDFSKENLINKKLIDKPKSFLENWADKFRKILNDSE